MRAAPGETTASIVAFYEGARAAADVVIDELTDGRGGGVVVGRRGVDALGVWSTWSRRRHGTPATWTSCASSSTAPTGDHLRRPDEPLATRLGRVTSLLGSINDPADLKRVDAAELPDLAQEIRDFLVDCGVAHRRAPRAEPRRRRADHRAAPGVRLAARRDRLGHRSPGLRPQAADRPAGRTSTALRQADGLSGYPSRAESPHDWVENSHASTALSYADGLAKAFAVRGETDRAVVAIVGDGSLTGGMCWEAMNTIAGGTRPAGHHRRQRQRPVVRADRRRSGRAPRYPAALAVVRAGPRDGADLAGPHAGRRGADLRGAARHEEGLEGLHPAAGDVRGSRAEVRRADRRARRAARSSALCATPATSARRSSCIA